MSKISFEQLYGDEKGVAFTVFLLWVNDFLEGFNVSEPVSINLERAAAFVNNLRKDVFPAANGYDHASPFKKAANIYTYLHTAELDPFKDVAHPDLITGQFREFPNAMTTLLGFGLVKTCLMGVEITRKDGTVAVLANPISVSHHFMGDLIEASGQITPAAHFKSYSLLFETLAYEANPGVCYPKVF